MWIALSIVILLILLLVIPLRFWAAFDEDLAVKLKWLFLSFTLFPAKEKPPKKAKAEKPAQKAKAPAKRNLRQNLELLQKALSASGPAMRFVLRRSVIAGIELDWVIGKEDAAETAIAYGRANAYAASTLALLRYYFRVKLKRVRITPDFSGQHSSFSLRFVYRISPAALLFAALLFFIRFVREQQSDKLQVVSGK